MNDQLQGFQLLVENTSDGLIVVDSKGLVRFANPAAERIFNKPAGHFTGRRFEFPLEAGKTSEIEIRLPIGSARIAEIRTSSIEWQGSPALLASIRDVTELRRVETLKSEIAERRRIDRLKDEFVSTVSHELRAPLTIIEAALENLISGVAGPISEIQQKVIKIASANAARLGNTLHEILDLSRLESGKAKINRKTMRTSEALREMAHNFDLLTQNKQIAFETNIPEGLPELSADEEMVNQIMTNLLNNALRYAKTKVSVQARSIFCSLSMKSETLKGDPDAFPAVEVSIRDDGPGIAREKLGELFSKYTQINRASGGNGYKGTGLGLAICKEVIRLHHGRIWAESEEGQGSCFKFILPQYDDKNGFWLALWSALNEAQLTHSEASLLIVSLKGLEKISPQEAEKLLQDQAERIRLRILRREDSVYTFENHIVIIALTNKEGGQAIRRRLADSLKDRILTDRSEEGTVHLRFETGLAVFPEDCVEPRFLYEAALKSTRGTV